MRGRIPKPIAQRIEEGSYKESRYGGRPTGQAAEGIECPEHLTGIARDEWQSLYEKLTALRVLTVTDLNALSIYCTAYARWREAEARVAEEGAVIESSSGDPKINPYLKISEKCVDQLRHLGNELGLTPVARARIRVSDARPDEDEVDKVMKIAG